MLIISIPYYNYETFIYLMTGLSTCSFQRRGKDKKFLIYGYEERYRGIVNKILDTLINLNKYNQCFKHFHKKENKDYRNPIQQNYFIFLK